MIPTNLWSWTVRPHSSHDTYVSTHPILEFLHWQLENCHVIYWSLLSHCNLGIILMLKQQCCSENKIRHSIGKHGTLCLTQSKVVNKRYCNRTCEWWDDFFIKTIKLTMETYQKTILLVFPSTRVLLQQLLLNNHNYKNSNGSLLGASGKAFSLKLMHNLLIHLLSRLTPDTSHVHVD